MDVPIALLADAANLSVEGKLDLLGRVDRDGGGRRWLTTCNSIERCHTSAC